MITTSLDCSARIIDTINVLNFAIAKYNPLEKPKLSSKEIMKIYDLNNDTKIVLAQLKKAK
jgi:hypothetical protein